ncbi:TIGR01777 family oxidoreductase [Rhodococcus sp. HNM0569]|uniref:TIGR01777 family oxidoreductase n=1 Tax=Rhodococcus sp. HNM0569 TaxID=2716340 RepID=UPI00146C8A70|nr:TIGR01777 family oxidoreductase [Rhodococcus sp. HNM0569]NLU84527.1 TIGR01777 family protein [Rhodococcus sp. HNM0569]
MDHEFEQVVDAPRSEVFAWFARPGALTRLSPPWLPMTPVREASDLARGEAVLKLPGGLTWTARHDPHAYQDGLRFADRSASFPLRTLVPWRHIHVFSDLPDGRTEVTDHVRTRVPLRALEHTFRYRHRQLADDLAAHHWAGAYLDRPLTVAVSGSSGMVGTALTAFLTTGGHRVIRLVRGTPRGDDERRWDPSSPAPDLLAGVDAVVHLAGAPIAGRFTGEHRAKIRGSRIEPTRLLAELAAATPDGPGVFVSASAVGFYGPDPGDEVLTEDADRGDGFLADVVVDWEAATLPAERAGLRVVNVRTGIVQSTRGGVLRLQRPLFALGLGGRLGSGEQWTPWIDLDDLVDVYHRALVDDSLSGPVNGVAPSPVRNREYTAVLAHVMHRPAVFPVPSLGPALLLGREGARELALAGQRAVPQRLTEREHRFRFPDLASCLRHQCGHLSREDAGS